ncbi:MAG TPA: gliding motility-associated C-terminal domain-containing protein [Cyclobacteriaceae bacterium]|nr:gliding motility-associated C-terminal domain-containing protein [Cyclobacteriaceae bacterium]
MKKLFIGLCLIAGASLSALAQTSIERIEYFFDTDPGLGSGVSIPITAGPVQDIDFSISTSGLTVGFHTLVIRAKHLSGAWGIEDYRVIYVASEAIGFDADLGDVEYYIDSDPGPGNGTSITIPTGVTSLDIARTINTSSLSSGFHILHIRAMDADANWGIPIIQPFYIVDGGVVTEDEIVQFEYFFDTEPGYGAGTQLSVTAGTQIDFPALINAASLSNGFHSIHIRARDSNGQWGFAEKRTFYVDGVTQVTELEYYIDTDPGEGNGTGVAITPGSLIDLDFIIPTTTLGGGSHIIGIRGASIDGTWGSTRTFSFSVQEDQTISFGALAAATYGDPPITLTGTSSAGLPLSYASSDPLVATISGSTITIVGAGTTTITASQAGDAGHVAATDIQQTLIVNKANQTITFGALAGKTVGDAPFTLNATTTSPLGLVYSSSNTAVATITGNTVTIVGAGTTSITASQAGNGNYNAATDVVQSLVVQPTPPVSNPPTISIQPATAFFINGSVVVNNSITIIDADGTVLSATVSIISGFQSSEDQLIFVSQAGIAGSYNSTTGVLTLSGSAAVADYQTTLRSIRYNNISPTPNTSNRTISFQVNDGTTASGTVTTTITINKPPAIEAPPKETDAGGNIAFVIEDIFSDPDDNLDFATLTVVSARGAQVTIASGIITVNYATIPDYKGTDELTMTICDQGGKCQSQIVTVEIGADIDVYNGISANGDDMNSYFRIRFLPAKSQVSIFNRWGDRVYENSDYDSNDATKRFEGVDSKGNELAEGTYYYKIVLPEGRERFGYIQIKR